MEKQYLNLNEVTNIKTLWHAAWLFSDKKNTEIILQVDEKNPLTNNLAVLKAQFMILSEGILNSSTDDNKRKPDIDYTGIHISDCYSLAKELTKLTGFKFSIALVKQS